MSFFGIFERTTKSSVALINLSMLLFEAGFKQHSD